jgi:senataxin
VFHRLAKHFDVVIIDEAAQAVEPSVMVPLVMGCKQVTHIPVSFLQAAPGSAGLFLL